MHKLPFVMTLSQLLVELAPQRCLEMENCADLEINGLCDDSRRVQPGDLFVALGGLSSDGRQFVEQAIARGIRNVWMQPGAESSLAVKACEEAGINVIADGSCALQH